MQNFNIEKGNVNLNTANSWTIIRTKIEREIIRAGAIH